MLYINAINKRNSHFNIKKIVIDNYNIIFKLKFIIIKYGFDSNMKPHLGNKTMV